MLAVVLLAGAGPADPRPALQDRALVVEDFHAQLRVESDGAVDVVESIRVRFDGAWSGFLRTIPVEYELPEGRYVLYVDVIEAVDEDGNPLEYDVDRTRHHKEIRLEVPDARDATRTIELHYRVPNGLRFFENHDELYWNVTGDRWEVPVLSASARVELPDRATGLRATAYTGTFGSRQEDVDAQETEYGFYFEATEELGFREGLTVVVGWDRGAVRRPGPVRRARIFLEHNVYVVVPLLSLLFMTWLWLRHGRESARRPVAPRDAPPDDLSPAEAGTLIDNSPDLRDITASLVDLAIRGYLRIEERERRGIARWLRGTDYAFVRLEPPESWRDLRSHERAILAGVFAGGKLETRLLGDLTNDFYEHLPTIRDELFRRLRRAGYYRHRPDEVKQVFVAVGTGVAVVALVGAILVSQTLALPEGRVILAALATAAPVFLFGPFMPARTLRGRRKLEEIMGFEEFLGQVESDRYRRTVDSAEQFEKYLPYAMALGMEERWARGFGDVYDEPPDWYLGTRSAPVRTTLLVGHLADFSTSAGTAMTSAPRGSGGSGFSRNRAGTGR